MRYLSLLLLAIPLVVHAQESDWVVPEDEQDDLSYFEFNDSTITVGRELYNQNCLSCHGNPGKANYQQLNPLPGDPAAEKIQNNTDGELHYKLVYGRGLMPAFGNVLTSDEIWNVISYLRTYNNNYQQVVGEKPVFAGFSGEVILMLSYLATENKIQCKVFDRVGEQLNPIAGAEMNIFAQRKFGNLPLSNPKSTNAKGVVEFNAPELLPGDTSGMISVIAQLADIESFGNIKKDTLLQIGVPTKPISLTEKRAMWNVFQKAPLWLYFAYFLSVLIAWGFIFYVVYHFREIYLIGQSVENDKNN